MPDFLDLARSHVESVQDEICSSLEAIDGASRFREDRWERPEGGGGRSRVLEGGAVIEKGGVNVSTVWGDLSSEFARRLPGHGGSFFATGVSLVIHPRNPYAPTVHANFRCLQRGDRLWFGGGGDLTPYYPFAEDCVEFHRVWKEVCDRHHPQFHTDFKAWCDRYFHLPHRGEPRGVGGIFFDYLRPVDDQEMDGRSGLDLDMNSIFSFWKDASLAFLPSFLPILRRRSDTPYGERERQWQLFRRGRYVEFNLLYDRGTVFGLQTGGRVESILMSLPPMCCWPYNHHPAPGSPEARLAHFHKVRDWANADPSRVEADLAHAVQTEASRGSLPS